MDVILRRGSRQDADACGVIVFEAFKSIASQHNFPLDIPSTEIGIGLATKMLSHPGFYSVIAEKDGKIVGSIFLDERGPIAAVDPLTIDPASQNQSLGRWLTLAALERTAERRSAGHQASAIGLSLSFSMLIRKARLPDPRAAFKDERSAVGHRVSRL